MDALARGRDAFDRRAWRDAYDLLTQADVGESLPAGDLERLAIAAYLTGRDADSHELWARAYREWLTLGKAPEAARCAFWLGHTLQLAGEMARGGGWIVTGQRLVGGSGADTLAARGLLLLGVAFECMVGGDAEGTHRNFCDADAIGEATRDPDLLALGRVGRGLGLLVLGERRAAVRCFDEAMVAITAEAVSPIAVGIVYCAVILACERIFDVPRARQWTTALSEWCTAQPDLVPYRGQCLVHRAELMHFQGDWARALQEARLACEFLSGGPVFGRSQYVLGEVHRLRGELAQAEEAYRSASRWGRDPQPGLALLWMATGRLEAATRAMRRVVEETTDTAERSPILAACTEIMVAAGDLAAARAAADELSTIARDLDAPLIWAVAHHAAGRVLVAEGEGSGALTHLRAAATHFQELEAPYELARVRVMLALACRLLGDAATAELELHAARSTFRELGAVTELSRLDRLVGSDRSRLTVREQQILRLVAEGHTNREIAEALHLSDHTVRRHLQNIFAKIGVSTRAAATAFALRHGLV